MNRVSHGMIKISRGIKFNKKIWMVKRLLLEENCQFIWIFGDDIIFESNSGTILKYECILRMRKCCVFKFQEINRPTYLDSNSNPTSS